MFSARLSADLRTLSERDRDYPIDPPMCRRIDCSRFCCTGTSKVADSFLEQALLRFRLLFPGLSKGNFFLFLAKVIIRKKETKKRQKKRDIMEGRNSFEPKIRDRRNLMKPALHTFHFRACLRCNGTPALVFGSCQADSSRPGTDVDALAAPGRRAARARRGRAGRRTDRRGGAAVAPRRRSKGSIAKFILLFLFNFWGSFWQTLRDPFSAVSTPILQVNTRLNSYLVRKED